MIVKLDEYQVGFRYKNKLTYKNTTSDIDTFRSSFLKRLGNVKGGCNIFKKINFKNKFQKKISKNYLL